MSLQGHILKNEAHLVSIHCKIDCVLLIVKGWSLAFFLAGGLLLAMIWSNIVL